MDKRTQESLWEAAREAGRIRLGMRGYARRWSCWSTDGEAANLVAKVAPLLQEAARLIIEAREAAWKRGGRVPTQEEIAERRSEAGY